MKKTKLLKTMAVFAMSAALLLSATMVFAEAKKTSNDVAVTAEADENGFVITDWGYITKYEGTAAEVTIPSSVNGIEVSGIGTEAFKDCTNLTKVTIPNGVT